MVKAYTLPIDYVLYDLSFANLTMYSAVIPSYTPKDDKGKGKQEKIKADDPRNRQRVSDLLASFKD